MNGIAACLNTAVKSGNVPSTFAYGPNCWCKITDVDNVKVSGAWVFDNSTLTKVEDCYSLCEGSCSNCVRSGFNGACTRNALFTTQ